MAEFITIPFVPPPACRVVSVDEEYGPEGVALLAAHPEWDLARLEFEMFMRNLRKPGGVPWVLTADQARSLGMSVEKGTQAFIRGPDPSGRAMIRFTPAAYPLDVVADPSLLNE